MADDSPDSYRISGGEKTNHSANAHRNTGRGRSAETVKTPKRNRNNRIRIIPFLIALPPLAGAADETTEFLEPTGWDKLWGYATLYKDDLNPVVQEFKLRGRYQGQYWDVDADQGSQSDWEDRRARLGFDAKLFDKQLEVRADFQSNDGFADLYDGLVDAYLRWKPSSTLSIVAGKTKPLIGHYDWLESTNTQPTFERSQIFNQLGVNRATSLTAEGTRDALSWRAGIYSNDTPANTGGSGSWGDGEFGDLNGGFAYSLGVGYDFKHLLDLEKADFRFDWLHSEREPGDLVLARYDDILSSTFWVKSGYSAVVLEGYYATGGDGSNSDVFGFFIQPSYDLIPKKLQLVGRYAFAHSDEDLGVVAQPRYERSVATNKGRGDTYHSLYGGLQYFIHGDKLKVLAGAEWARLENNSKTAYDGWTLLTGLRLSF